MTKSKEISGRKPRHILYLVDTGGVDDLISRTSNDPTLPEELGIGHAPGKSIYDTFSQFSRYDSDLPALLIHLFKQTKETGLSSLAHSDIVIPNAKYHLHFSFDSLTDRSGRSDQVMCYVACQSELTQSKRRAERLFEELSDVNAGMLAVSQIILHDLKGPIATIEQANEYLFESAKNGDVEKAQRFHGMINNQTQRTFNRLARLKRFFQLNSGQYPHNPCYHNLVDEIINPVFDGLYVVAEKRNIGLAHKIPTDLKVFCDKDNMELVFENGIGNALKYAAQGSRIDLGYEDHSDYHQFNIWNNGSYVPRDQLKRIFRQFVRLNDDSLPFASGYGIGLTNVGKLIGLHNGKAWAESDGSSYFNLIFRIPKKEIK
ncbi:MAG: HAMP domain-containing sensor histidine kinase [Candidatus Woesearchaeota archaeon]